MKNIICSLMVYAFVLYIIGCNTNFETDVEKTDSSSEQTISPEANSLNKASWLIGAWVHDSADTRLFEEWKKPNDSTFTGKSIAVVGKDTVHSEDIIMLQKNDTLFYVPTVKGQNNNKPVWFENTTFSAQSMVSENYRHDYPTKIAYAQIAEDSLVAEVSGIVKGNSTVETFSMKRIQ